MFIDVTRYGGQRPLRLATSAIAYMDAVDGGSAIHLVGGETLRVSETPEGVEQAIAAAMTLLVAPLCWRDTLEDVPAPAEARDEVGGIMAGGVAPLGNVLPLDPVADDMERALIAMDRPVLTRKPRGRR